MYWSRWLWYTVHADWADPVQGKRERGGGRQGVRENRCLPPICSSCIKCFSPPPGKGGVRDTAASNDLLVSTTKSHVTKNKYSMISVSMGKETPVITWSSSISNWLLFIIFSLESCHFLDYNDKSLFLSSNLYQTEMSICCVRKSE